VITSLGNEIIELFWGWAWGNLFYGDLFNIIAFAYVAVLGGAFDS
jgi:hypothetical protein